MKNIISGLLIFICMSGSTVLAHAEYRVYDHAGCTKDGVKVTQEIFWNCNGLCSTTPLKPTIMREAKASRAAYPKVVAKLTKSQVNSGAHGPLLIKRAHLTKKLISPSPVKFGGRCR